MKHAYNRDKTSLIILKKLAKKRLFMNLNRKGNKVIIGLLSVWQSISSVPIRLIKMEGHFVWPVWGVEREDELEIGQSN